MDLSNDGPQPLSRIPDNSRPVKWIRENGEVRKIAYGWRVWEEPVADGQINYYHLGGSTNKRPRIYKWTGEGKSGWSVVPVNTYLSPEGLDEQELWEKYGRID